MMLDKRNIEVGKQQAYVQSVYGKISTFEHMYIEQYHTIGITLSKVKKC